MRKVSNLNERKLQRRIDALIRRHDRLQAANKHTAVYLEKIVNEIERLKKLKAKVIYTSKVLVYVPDEIERPKLHGIVSWGPALKGMDNTGKTVYSPSFNPPRNITL